WNRGWMAVIVAFLFLVVAGFSLTEATGATKVLQTTVIRLFRPDGTLVVEIDDPDVKVRIDGEELIIDGAGLKELRLRPGRYEVQANKDGKVGRQVLVTVTKGGREVVRISREGARTTSTKVPAFSDRRAAEYVLSVGGSVRVDDLARDVT